MKLSEQFHLDNRSRMLIKIGVVVVLAVASIMLYLNNRELAVHNKKMLKFIKNKVVFQKNLESLQESSDKFDRYIIKLQKDSDLEKIKGEHINKLLGMVKQKNLKVDSYRSEIEKKDGFVIFKYNLTIVGDFVQAIRLFSSIGTDAAHYRIYRYNIRKYQEHMVRMGVIVEMTGIEG